MWIQWCKDGLNNEYSTRGPPGFIVWPAAALVNCVYTIKITQQFTRLGIPIIVNFPRAAGRLTGSNLCGPLP